MIYILNNKYININLLERQIIECIWTIIPAIILIQIAIPSLLLLYILEESIDSSLTIKVLGHQWYWRYEYTDFWSIRKNVQIEFDSYIIPQNELEINIFRLLDVDNRTIIPYNIHIPILISSADVLHAWTVPSLKIKSHSMSGGLDHWVKADAISGNLNKRIKSNSMPGSLNCWSKYDATSRHVRLSVAAYFDNLERMKQARLLRHAYLPCVKTTIDAYKKISSLFKK